MQGKWYRHFCALVASTFQMMGTIMYLGSEWHVGFIHLPTFVSHTHLYVFHMCCLGHLVKYESCHLSYMQCYRIGLQLLTVT